MYVLNVPCSKDSTNLDRWKQLLETSLNEQASWQNHIAQNQPEIDLQTFDTIEEICQGNIYVYIIRLMHVQANS